jgi:hypothetical protein
MVAVTRGYIFSLSILEALLFSVGVIRKPPQETLEAVSGRQLFAQSIPPSLQPADRELNTFSSWSSMLSRIFYNSHL